MFIPLMYCVIEYPTVSVTGSFDRIREYFLVLAFVKPAAFRICRALLDFFCIRNNTVAITRIVVITVF